MLSSIRISARVLAVAVVGLIAMPAMAVSTVYNSAATFNAAVQAGAYTETFSTSAANAPSASFSGGAYAYTISSPNSVYRSGAFIGTVSPSDTLTITFTAGNPTAIGGNFYLTDFSDNAVSGLVSITLSDGTLTTFTAANAASFRGFTSSVPITSLTVAAPVASTYNSLDNLVVGQAVPEPTTLALLGLGGLALVRRRA